MIYLIIRHAKASEQDNQCPLCTSFLSSEAFKFLCIACVMIEENLEVIDLNVDPRAEKFYRLFPSGSLTLPAIIAGKRVIKRVDALHPYTLLSMLFGDVSRFGLLDLKEAEKSVKKVIKPSSLELKILTLIKAGLTAEEIAKKLNVSKKRVEQFLEKIKSQQVK